MRKEIDEGRAAYANKTPRQCCPYPSGPGINCMQAIDWIFGWDSAADLPAHEAEYGPVSRTN